MKRFVQKSWHALINILIKRQWFVLKHLKNSESNSSLFQKSEARYHMQPHIPETIYSLMIFNNAESDNDRLCFDIDEFNLPESIAGFGCSHCDGLLFIVDRNTNSVLLCNRAVREIQASSEFMLWIQL